MLLRLPKLKNAIALFAVPAFFACSPIQIKSGRHFTVEQIGSIEKGKTVKDEIVKIFGEPQLTGKDDSGLDTWSYIYIEAAVPLRGGEAKETFRRLTVTFEDGTVKSINYETSK